jgi:hypothetical protein
LDMEFDDSSLGPFLFFSPFLVVSPLEKVVVENYSRKNGRRIRWLQK